MDGLPNVAFRTRARKPPISSKKAIIFPKKAIEQSPLHDEEAHIRRYIDWNPACGNATPCGQCRSIGRPSGDTSDTEPYSDTPARDRDRENPHP